MKIFRFIAKAKLIASGKEAKINDIFPLRKSQINSIGYDALELMVYRQHCT